MNSSLPFVTDLVFLGLIAGFWISVVRGLLPIITSEQERSQNLLYQVLIFLALCMATFFPILMVPVADWLPVVGVMLLSLGVGFGLEMASSRIPVRSFQHLQKLIITQAALAITAPSAFLSFASLHMLNSMMASWGFGWTTILSGLCILCTVPPLLYTFKVFRDELIPLQGQAIPLVVFGLCGALSLTLWMLAL